MESLLASYPRSNPVTSIAFFHQSFFSLYSFSSSTLNCRDTLFSRKSLSSSSPKSSAPLRTIHIARYPHQAKFAPHSSPSVSAIPGSPLYWRFSSSPPIRPFTPSCPHSSTHMRREATTITFHTTHKPGISTRMMKTRNQQQNVGGEEMQTQGNKNKNDMIRVLCLHGYTQNAQAFRERMGSMRKGLKKFNVDFIYVNAPHVVEVEANGTSAGSDMTSQDQEKPDQEHPAAGDKEKQVQRTWWYFKSSNLDDNRPSLSYNYSEWETSVYIVIQAIKNHKPHILLGFSQGAAMTAVTLAHLILNHSNNNYDSSQNWMPSHAIMISGFAPRDQVLSSMITTAFDPTRFPNSQTVKLMFIAGQNDNLVLPQRTQELCTLMRSQVESNFVTHDRGHMIPYVKGLIKEALDLAFSQIRDVIDRDSNA